jgi:TolA-binding protein
MKKSFSTCAAALFAWTSVAAPAMAQNREHQQLAAEARMLQEQTQQLAIALATISEALKAMNGRFDEAADANRRNFADQKLAVDNMANDVRVVRERTDDTNLRIATLREELEALRGSVQVIQQLALTPPAVPIDPNAPVDPNAPAPVTPVPTPLPSALGLSPTRLFETAKADYFAGQWSLAISGLEAFLKSFPRSEFSGEAQHYIGESFAAQNRWPDAITAYNLVIQGYPMSSIVPETYYKRGLAQERLGDLLAARASWEAVIAAQPDSDGARLAKQSLDRVARQRPAP